MEFEAQLQVYFLIYLVNHFDLFFFSLIKYSPFIGCNNPENKFKKVSSNNNVKEDNVSVVQSIIREPVNNNPVNNNKPDKVETNDKSVQEPEPELEPEQDLTLQIEDSTDEFLNGIDSGEKP